MSLTYKEYGPCHSDWTCRECRENRRYGSNTIHNLFKYVRGVKDAPKQSEELKEEVLLIQDALEDLKTTLESTPLTVPATMITRLQGAVMQGGEVLKVMADQVLVQKGKRFEWPFTQKQNEEYLVELERFRSTVLLALSAEGRS
jgi:hypothetical protein